MMSSTNTTSTATSDVCARSLRMFRRGAQGAWQRPQVPSGSGPSAQVPPARLGRRHSQRSPVRVGAHSDWPPHWPLIPGPCQHDFFHMPERPQRNGCAGRS